MQDAVDAELVRARIERGREGRVDERNDTARSSNAHDSLDVDELQGRVRRRFQVHDSSIGPNGLLETVGLRRAEPAHVNAVSGKKLESESMRAAIDFALHDRVVALLQVREQRRRNSGHSRAEDGRGLRGLELRHDALRERKRRVPVSCVERVSFRFFERDLLVDVCGLEGRREVDRRRHGLVRSRSFFVGVNGSCRRAEIVAFHVTSSLGSRD